MRAESRDLDYEIISKSVNDFSAELQDLSLKIHKEPELCFEEVQAHRNITDFLEEHGFTVKRHAFGLKTSFVAEAGSCGRIVTFCSEYDGLPDIGHGCGHNLIATSSMAAFLGTAAALKARGIPGRVRLLGCPAEEGGAGKMKLIKAGAFEAVDAALMIHPTPPFADLPADSAGVSYATCLASCGFTVTFSGQAAHGAAAPWAGINALDAASLAYTAVGLLRQQMRPTDRVQIRLDNANSALNVIPDQGTVRVCVRSETAGRRDELRVKIENCFKGAAIATGCRLEVKETMHAYADLRPNEPLCAEFSWCMSYTNQEFICDLQNRYLCSFGTDMGNVSYEVPSFHGTFTIPTEPGTVLHSEGFARAAATPESHAVALEVGKGMAAVGMRVLADDDFNRQVREFFEKDKLSR